MNTFWLICTLLAIAAFVIGETYAFRHPDRQNTLSRAIYNLGAKWPLSIFIMGMFAGGLAVHFFWHWCPDLGLGTGFLIDKNCTLGPLGTNIINCPLGALHG